MPTMTLDATQERLARTLDRVEERLPPLTRMMFRFNRSVASLGRSLLLGAANSASETSGTIAASATTGARTVRGQARSAAARTMETGTGAAKEVIGQARAQSEQVLDTIAAEAQSVAGDATVAIETMEVGSYQTWTKAKLYDRAQELEIRGRSAMNKDQLIDAIVEAS